MVKSQRPGLSYRVLLKSVIESFLDKKNNVSVKIHSFAGLGRAGYHLKTKKREVNKNGQSKMDILYYQVDLMSFLKTFFNTGMTWFKR